MSDTGYQDENEVAGSITIRVHLQMTPADVDLASDDELPELDDIKEQIEEQLIDAAAEEMSHGRVDIEVDNLDGIAREMLSIIEAEKNA